MIFEVEKLQGSEFNDIQLEAQVGVACLNIMGEITDMSYRSATMAMIVTTVVLFLLAGTLWVQEAFAQQQHYDLDTGDLAFTISSSN